MAIESWEIEFEGIEALAKVMGQTSRPPSSSLSNHEYSINLA